MVQCLYNITKEVGLQYFTIFILLNTIFSFLTKPFVNHVKRTLHFNSGN